MRSKEDIEEQLNHEREILAEYIAKREKYLAEYNEFAFKVMIDGANKQLAKIEALEWVLNNG